MKKHLTGNIKNAGEVDCVVNYDFHPNVDEQGQRQWVNEEESICRCHTTVNYVRIYVPDRKATGTVQIVDIYASTIKDLYKAVCEIEAIEKDVQGS